MQCISQIDYDRICFGVGSSSVGSQQLSTYLLEVLGQSVHDVTALAVLLQLPWATVFALLCAEAEDAGRQARRRETRSSAPDRSFLLVLLADASMDWEETGPWEGSMGKQMLERFGADG